MYRPMTASRLLRCVSGRGARCADGLRERKSGPAFAPRGPKMDETSAYVSTSVDMPPVAPAWDSCSMGSAVGFPTSRSCVQSSSGAGECRSISTNARGRSAPPDWCWRRGRARRRPDRARRHPGAVRAGRGELQEGHDGPGSQRLPARGAPPARKPIVSACRRARRPSFSRTCWTAAIACRRRPAIRAGRGELQEEARRARIAAPACARPAPPRGSQSSALAGGLDVPASAEHAGPLQSPAAGVPPGLHHADDLAHPGAWRRAGRRRIARDRDPGAGRERAAARRHAGHGPGHRRADAPNKAAPAGGRGRPDGARPRAPIGRSRRRNQAKWRLSPSHTHTYPCPTSSP